MPTAARRGRTGLALVIVSLAAASLTGCSRFAQERAQVHQETITLRADVVTFASVDE